MEIDEHFDPRFSISDFNDLYGFICNEPYVLVIDGKDIPVFDLLTYIEYEGVKISQYQLNLLNDYSNDAFIKVLKESYFTPKTVIPFLRENFDSYRMQDLNPMDWLLNTLDLVLNNPHMFKPEIRGIMETNLMEWIDTYSMIETNYESIPKPNPETVEAIKGIWEGDEKGIFINDKDKNEFIAILAEYIDSKTLPDLPNKTFNTKNRTMLRATRLLKEIWEIYPTGKNLKHDTDFYKIIRLLDTFKDKKNIYIYNNLTKGI